MQFKTCMLGTESPNPLHGLLRTPAPPDGLTRVPFHCLCLPCFKMGGELLKGTSLRTGLRVAALFEGMSRSRFKPGLPISAASSLLSFPPFAEAEASRPGRNEYIHRATAVIKGFGSCRSIGGNLAWVIIFSEGVEDHAGPGTYKCSSIVFARIRMRMHTRALARTDALLTLNYNTKKDDGTRTPNPTQIGSAQPMTAKLATTDKCCNLPPNLVTPTFIGIVHVYLLHSPFQQQSCLSFRKDFLGSQMNVVKEQHFCSELTWQKCTNDSGRHARACF